MAIIDLLRITDKSCRYCFLPFLAFSPSKVGFELSFSSLCTWNPDAKLLSSSEIYGFFSSHSVLLRPSTGSISSLSLRMVSYFGNGSLFFLAGAWLFSLLLLEEGGGGGGVDSVRLRGES